MPKKNIQPEGKDSKKPKSGKSESPFSDSRISENQNSESRIYENQESVVSPYLEIEKLYTIDDMIDVWCRGCTNGATLWQYCQDTEKPLPVSFEAGLIELVNEVRNSDNKQEALKTVTGNNLLLLGVFTELQ